MKAVADTLGVSRSNLVERQERPIKAARVLSQGRGCRDSAHNP